VLLRCPEVKVQPHHVKLQSTLHPQVLLQPLDRKLFSNLSAEVPHVASICNDKHRKENKKCPIKVKKRVHTRQRREAILSSELSAELVKTNTNSFSCIKCKKEFVNRYRLNDHMKIHNQPHAFECKNCPKAFPRKSNLNKHMLIHSNDPRLICSFCGKKFSRTAGVKRHEMVHRAEKPHNCSQCNKSFTRPHLLQSHLERIHSPLTCKVCKEEVPKHRFKSQIISPEEDQIVHL